MVSRSVIGHTGTRQVNGSTVRQGKARQGKVGREKCIIRRELGGTTCLCCADNRPTEFISRRRGHLFFCDESA